MLLTAAIVGAVGAWGVVRAADSRAADVERVDGLDGVLAPLDETGEYPAVNYLLVGSDSREGASGEDADFGLVGDESAVSGRRSDTIMILRQERNGGLSLLSLPRDLWLPISGTGESQRINTAFNDGPERLASTITQSLGIPIHHYVEVDFVGFKEIIDELGGVNLCVWHPARDHKSGLHLDAGCQQLDGVMALAYARSRTYQEWDGTDWVVDPRADLGRIQRQQLFIRAAIDGTLGRLQSSPFSSGDLVGAVADSVKIDSRLDPFDAAETLRSAAQTGVRTFRLPVDPTTVGDAAVLELGGGAQQVLDYFSGTGPAPIEFETTAETTAAASVG